MIFSSAFSFGLACWIFNMSLNLIAPLKDWFPNIEKFDSPLDRGASLRDGHRIFGDSITISGMVFALILPFVIAPLIQQSLALVFLKCSCAYVGGAAGSFVKRRLGFPRGRFLPFVDHGDYMLATIFVFCAFGFERIDVAIVALAGTFVIHPMVSYLSYLLGIKRQPL